MTTFLETEIEKGVYDVLKAIVERLPWPSQAVKEELLSIVEKELGPTPAPEDPAVVEARVAAQRAELEAQLAALGPVPSATPVEATTLADPASAPVPGDMPAYPAPAEAVN